MVKALVIARSVLKNEGPVYVSMPAFPMTSSPGKEKVPLLVGCGSHMCRVWATGSKAVRLVFMWPWALGRHGAEVPPTLWLQSCGFQSAGCLPGPGHGLNWPYPRVNGRPPDQFSTVLNW